MNREIITALTMVELLAKIYKANHWQRCSGESRTRRAMAIYSITLDARANRFVATRKVAA